MAVCGYCGAEADVTITADNKHTYTYPEMQCRYLQEQAANKPEGASIPGECPHFAKAVDEEVAELRAED